jgi:pSer/pThr/pTyr-binding forkhead associated (FHA) protein
MTILLSITDTRNPGEHFTRSFVQQKVTIGRARYCDVCLPDLSVSTSHAEIKLHNNEFYLMDSGSVNGTFLQGAKLISHRPRKLVTGDVFTVAHFEIQYKSGASQSASLNPNQAQQQALDMLGAVLSMAPVPVIPSIVIVSGLRKDTRFQLPAPPSVAIIGRSNQADIYLNDRHIARRHAEVAVREDRVFVRDLGSKTGIRHNGVQRPEFTLTRDCTFTVGETTFALAHPLDPSLYHIQNAPEDQTASYCVNIPAPTTPDENAVAPGTPPIVDMEPDRESQPHKEANRKDTEPNDMNHGDDADTDKNASDRLPVTEPAAPLPVPLPTGPADPLAPPSRPPEEPLSALPEDPPSAVEEKSDLGLIVVGAIVVVSCVLALIWLLT